MATLPSWVSQGSANLDMVAPLRARACEALYAVLGSKRRPVATGPRCVALWGVGDPGNVGTVLRSALAFGADSVALGPGSADPFSPKAVRASMGAIFSVPVARVKDPAELPGPRIALAAREGAPLHELREPCTLLMIPGGKMRKRDAGENAYPRS